MLPPRPLLGVWGGLPYPTLFSAGWGLVPRSVAQLCALQPLVPFFRVYLSEAVGFGGFLGSLLCAPLAVGLLPGSPNQLCPLSADCLLGLEPSPSGVASAPDGRFSWHPGAAGALAVPSLRLRVSESSSLSAWSFPFRGLSLFLAFVPLLEALSESLTHSFPRSFLVVALYASAVGFADALWLCPDRALRRLFASVSLLAPGALSPLLHRVFPDGFRYRCTFRFCGGASPLVGGVAVGLLLFAGCLWCSGRCFLFTVRHSARIHGDHLVSFTDSCVSLARHPRMGLFLGHLRGVCLVELTVLLHALPGLSFVLTSGHDSTVLIPPAIDSGESLSFTVGLTPCYCGVLGGLHVLVGSSTYPLLGRMLGPSSFGLWLCWRRGCRPVPSSHFLDTVYYLACSLDGSSYGFLR